MRTLEAMSNAADQAKALMLSTNKSAYVYLSGNEYVVTDVSPVDAPNNLILIGETRPRGPGR